MSRPTIDANSMGLKLLVLAAAVNIVARASWGCGRGAALEGLAVGMGTPHEDLDELTMRSARYGTVNKRFIEVKGTTNSPHGYVQVGHHLSITVPAGKLRRGGVGGHFFRRCNRLTRPCQAVVLLAGRKSSEPEFPCAIYLYKRQIALQWENVFKYLLFSTKFNCILLFFIYIFTVKDTIAFTR